MEEQSFKEKKFLEGNEALKGCWKIAQKIFRTFDKKKLLPKIFDSNNNFSQIQK